MKPPNFPTFIPSLPLSHVGHFLLSSFPSGGKKCAPKASSSTSITSLFDFPTVSSHNCLKVSQNFRKTSFQSNLPSEISSN